MLSIQDVSYIHPNNDLLFEDLNLIINKQDKAALVGKNGAGKSTLLNMMAGLKEPSAGHVTAISRPYLVPQHFGQFNDLSLAQALQVDLKLAALSGILNGNLTDELLTTLNDDWSIETRCEEALRYWQLEGLALTQKMGGLSGGQKTRVFLAGIHIHHPSIVLLDEPSNHLDGPGRELLYHYVKTTKSTLVMVSHDRTLLNLPDVIYELSPTGLNTYGGNYDFYAAQKSLEVEVLTQELKGREKALRKARAVERDTLERQQKLDARGKKKQAQAGIPTIAMNTLRNKAERSTAKIKDIHEEKITSIAQGLSQLRQALPGTGAMKMNLDHTQLPIGKNLVSAEGINFSYLDQLLWGKALDFQISSGQRLSIKGGNGTGKTTLMKLILASLEPTIGKMQHNNFKTVYIDQDYSLISGVFSVYELAEQYNSGSLQEHEVKIRLNRFLFTKEDWDKPCNALSGGEKMRLLLCMLAITGTAPDMILLDEPTNNLDIQNVDILISAINEYVGTLIVVSHDEHFLEQIHVVDSITLR